MNIKRIRIECDGYVNQTLPLINGYHPHKFPSYRKAIRRYHKMICMLNNRNLSVDYTFYTQVVLISNNQNLVKQGIPYVDKESKDVNDIIQVDCSWLPIHIFQDITNINVPGHIIRSSGEKEFVIINLIINTHSYAEYMELTISSHIKFTVGSMVIPTTFVDDLDKVSNPEKYHLYVLLKNDGFYQAYLYNDKWMLFKEANLHYNIDDKSATRYDILKMAQDEFAGYCKRYSNEYFYLINKQSLLLIPNDLISGP